MKKIWAAMVGSVLLSGSALADDAYPRSAELTAAQTELDAVKALGPRNKLSAEDQQHFEAAVKTRDAQLDRRNDEWKQKDSTSMLKAQAETCSVVRQGLDQGKKSTDYFDTLRYAGFSTDEALDIVLQIPRRTPQGGQERQSGLLYFGPSDRHYEAGVAELEKDDVGVSEHARAHRGWHRHLLV